MFVADDNTSLKVDWSFKVNDKFKSSHKKGDNVKDMMEKKILTLPTFPSNRQIDVKNYSTWVMLMEVVLGEGNSSIDLTVAIPSSSDSFYICT